MNMQKSTVSHRAPFEIGDRVAIIRSKHGWFNGACEGIIIRREQRPQGTWSYVVRGDDGQEHDIRHTRDLSIAD